MDTSGNQPPIHWILITVGLGVVVVAGDTAWQCMRASSWPTVRGEILLSGVEDLILEDRDGDTRTRFKPRLRYRYSVKGKDYIGHRVSYGFEWHGYEWTAQRIADRYPVGKRVRVHVSPADPAEASLECGVTFAAVGALAGGIALIVVGFLLR